jgi:ribosomal protein L10
MPPSTTPTPPVSLDNSERARALAEIERRINEARAIVFANADGIVPRLMTDLEREWRALSQTPEPRSHS